MVKQGVKSLLWEEAKERAVTLVNSTASTHLQWGSRAAHITVKAISSVGVSGSLSSENSSGVLETARFEGELREAGDPSRLPLSGQSCSYKPKVKSSDV